MQIINKFKLIKEIFKILLKIIKIKVYAWIKEGIINKGYIQIIKIILKIPIM